MHNFPQYASGAGYVLTPDIVKFFGYPTIGLSSVTVEDRRIGQVLYGFNVTFKNAQGFHPWGHCNEPGVVLIHYQRARGVFERMYNRALRAENLCGPGFRPPTVCARGKQQDQASLECANGAVVTGVQFANYGSMLPGEEHSAKRWCGEGPDELLAGVNPACAVNVSRVVWDSCRGKSKCALKVAPEVLNAGVDPCKGKYKHLQFVVECGVERGAPPDTIVS